MGRLAKPWRRGGRVSARGVCRRMKAASQLLVAVCLMGVFCKAGHAQTGQNQWWPEVDTFVRLNPKVRLSFFAQRSTDGKNYNGAEIGPNLDIALKPLRKRISTNDVDKNKLVVFRIGYRYLGSTDGPSENRGILQLTQRFPLPRSFLVSDRNRSDLRWIGGRFSWRYRNLLTVERTVKIKSFSFNPYVEGEVYFDSRYEKWSKNSYSFGMGIPLGKRFEAKPYFERDNQSHSSLQHVNGVGFILYLYF